MLGVRKSCLKLGSWDWASGVSGTGGAALSALTRRQCCMANVQEVIGVTNREFSIPRAPQKIRRVLHRQPYSNRECRDVFGGQAGRWFSGSGSRDCDATDVASFGILASCIAQAGFDEGKKDGQQSCSDHGTRSNADGCNRLGCESKCRSSRPYEANPKHEQQVHLKPLSYLR